MSRLPLRLSNKNVFSVLERLPILAPFPDLSTSKARLGSLHVQPINITINIESQLRAVANRVLGFRARFYATLIVVSAQSPQISQLLPPLPCLGAPSRHATPSGLRSGPPSPCAGHGCRIARGRVRRRSRLLRRGYRWAAGRGG